MCGVDRWVVGVVVGVAGCSSPPRPGVFCSVQASEACWYLDFGEQLAAPALEGKRGSANYFLREGDGGDFWIDQSGTRIVVKPIDADAVGIVDGSSGSPVRYARK